MINAKVKHDLRKQQGQMLPVKRANIARRGQVLTVQFTKVRNLLEVPEVRTQRLKLSKLIASDAPAMYEYRSVPKICKYQSFEPNLLSDVEAFISSLESNTFNEPGTWSQFAMRLLDTGKLIGDLGIHFVDDDSSQVEIGFTVSHEYQKMGYGTEAVMAVLDYLFVSLQKHRVYASVDPGNAPSIALLKRVGMRQEAHFRESIWFKGSWVDDMVFGILKSEWLNR